MVLADNEILFDNPEDGSVLGDIVISGKYKTYLTQADGLVVKSPNMNRLSPEVSLDFAKRIAREAASEKYQIAVNFTNDKDARLFAKSLDNSTYAIIIKDISPSPFNEVIYEVVSIFMYIGLAINLLFLYAILGLVTRNTMATRKKDFAISRSNGANQREIGILVILQQLIISVFSFLLIAVAMIILGKYIPKEYLNLSYFYWYHYIILFVTFMLFALWLGFRFNKGFSNEVRAVEDLSIDFPKQGLVTLFGHSGSGKTTLLNIVGGLEKPSTNKVYYGDDIIKNFDDIRSKRIGYVFQNYNLFTNLSVFDNVSFVLKMNGITDKEFIKEHVEYALDLVNMLPYARKKATELSGGQQQRVAIARALVKNPDFIIADEPTGNIDSKNKLEVMNILRTIADQKLVILVTHEKHLADYYSDRIITIKDGKIISDEANTPKTSHGFVDDNKIYLKDLSHETINEEDLKVDYYYDQKPKLDVKLIYQNGSLYIHLPTNLKSSIINDSSSIQAVDQSREEIDDSLVETEFRVEHFDIPEEKYTKKQLFSLKSMFKVSFSKLFNQRTRRILLIIGLILSGLLFGVGITQFGAAVKKPEYKEVSYDVNSYELQRNIINPNPDNFKDVFFRSFTFRLEQLYATKPGYRTDSYADSIHISPNGLLKESE